MTIGFSEVVYTVSESAGAALVCVDLIGSSQRTIVAILSTADSESQDLQLPNMQVLAFQNGQGQVCTSVTITNDAIVEDQESFTLLLNTTDPAVDNNFRMIALLNITDDDCKLIDSFMFVLVFVAMYLTGIFLTSHNPVLAWPKHKRFACLCM